MGTQMPKDKFENYEIAHFRLLSDSNWLPYGKSMVEPARRTWKQVQLMEDAMLIHRLVRAPDRRVIKVDIGNIPPSEVDNFMTKLMSKVKNIPLIDQQTGDYNLKYNLMNIIEDFYLPVRGGDSGTSIENLSGLTFSATEDVEYLRNKMIGGLKVPRAFLGYEEQLSGKSTLAAEDVRFARTIERIQRILVSELTKIAIVHLYAQGYTDESLVNFSLELTNPSTIYEQEKIALWQEKVRLAGEMQQINLIGSSWIYEHIFGMSEEEVDDQRIQVVKDKKRGYRLQSIEQGDDPQAAGGTQTSGEESMGGESDDGNEEGGKEGGEVDLSGLPTAEEGLIQDDKGPGRPPEGDTYGTDRHVYGRDPLGNKENKKALHRDPEGKKTVRRKGLSREGLELQQFMIQLKGKYGVPVKNTKILTESSEKRNYLDESKLLGEK
ncbi:MAG TPA: portal protein, partial [Candidatus Glassbacteria bacterium]|nr:portal protein [Candidatus Glassbacteria bacterium]